MGFEPLHGPFSNSQSIILRLRDGNTGILSGPPSGLSTGHHRSQSNAILTAILLFANQGVNYQLNSIKHPQAWDVGRRGLTTHGGDIWFLPREDKEWLPPGQPGTDKVAVSIVWKRSRGGTAEHLGNSEVTRKQRGSPKRGGGA